MRRQIPVSLGPRSHGSPRHLGPSRWLPLLVLLALLAPPAADADPTPPRASTQTLADRPPILLRTTLLLPPAASAGSGLEPEVSIRLGIGADGSITSAQVTAVEPSTDYDEVFRAHTLAQLARWRYAPAIENGETVASELTWKVSYRSAKPGGQAALASEPHSPLLSIDFSRQLEDTFARRDRVADLSAEDRGQLLQTLITKAHEHLTKGRIRQFETGRCIVLTDAEDENTAQAVAASVEATLASVHSYLQPLEPYPHDLKLVAVVFSNLVAYKRFQAVVLRQTGSEGSYVPPGLLSLHNQVASSTEMMSHLLHEVTHAYVDHHLRRPGVVVPRWFEEGLAEYVGSSTVRRGKIVPGKIRKREYVLGHFGAFMRSTSAGWTLARIQRTLSEDAGMPLRRWLGLDRKTFYMQDAGETYGVSWMFVHFLRHGRDEWAETAFPQLALYLAEGYPSIAAIEAAYGLPLSQLETELRRYARKL